MSVHGLPLGGDVEAVTVLVGEDDVIGGIRDCLRACAVVILSGEVPLCNECVEASLELRCPRDVALADVLIAPVCVLLADELAEAGDEAVWIDSSCRELFL